MKRPDRPHRPMPCLWPVVLATAGGFLFSLFPLRLQFGVDMVFGHAFSMLVSLVYGPWWGALSAAVAGVPTIWEWHAVSGLVVGVAESVWVGFWYRRLKGWLMELDILFWLLLGGPFTYVWVGAVGGLPQLDSAVLALKAALNGLTVTAVGGVLAMLWPARWASKRLEHSLRGYLSSALALCCIAPLGLVLGYGQQAYENVRTDRFSHAQEAAEEAGQGLQQLLHETDHLVQELTARSLHYRQQPAELQGAVASLAASHKYVDRIFVTDAEGSIIAASPDGLDKAVPGIGLRMGDRAYFQKVRATGQPTVFGGIVGRISNQPVAIVAHPIRDGSGTFHGVAGATLRLGNDLYRQVHERSSVDLPHVLVDGQGRVLYATVPGLGPLDIYTTPPGMASLSSPESHELDRLRIRDWARAEMTLRTPVPGTDWTLYTISSLTQVKAAVFTVYQGLLIMALAIIVLTTLVLRVVTEMTIRPIAEMASLNIRQISLSKDGRVERWLQSPIPEVRRLVANLVEGARQLSLLAFFDPLTELPNRHLLTDHLQALAEQPASERRPAALLYLDLAGFKAVNESLGHQTGDQLLRAAAKRILSWVGPADLAARLGGDEFAILVDGVVAEEEAVTAGLRLADRFAAPFLVDGHQIFLTAHVGVLAGAEVSDPEVVLRFASLAMQEAKRRGEACAVFSNQMNAISLSRLELEAQLHRALEQGELVLHYQPVVMAATGRIGALEALVRWQHPERGLVMPAEFIPLAEETGLILPLGRWVLEEACRQGAAWQAQLPDRPPVPVSINLSGRQFQHQNLDEVVAEVLLRTGVHPAWVQLEITETMTMRDPQAARETLRRLKKLGVSLALDDFGTGYSSMGYLKRFDMDVLKIDRSFVQDVADDEDAAAIVLTIVTLARAVHMDVVAEGVETPAQWQVLKGLGVDRGQGFLFSRGVPAAQATVMLEANAALWSDEDGSQQACPAESHTD